MVKFNRQERRTGDNSFELLGKYTIQIICKQMIMFDFNKTYKLSVWMRTQDKQFPARGNSGLFMYDKKTIKTENVRYHLDTETALATKFSCINYLNRIIKSFGLVRG